MNKKKLLALLLALVMIFTLVPVTALAEFNSSSVTWDCSLQNEFYKDVTSVTIGVGNVVNAWISSDTDGYKVSKAVSSDESVARLVDYTYEQDGDGNWNVKVQDEWIQPWNEDGDLYIEGVSEGIAYIEQTIVDENDAFVDKVAFTVIVGDAIFVSAAQVSITEGYTKADAVIGTPFTLHAVVSPENATYNTVTWSTEDASVATISQDGNTVTVTPVAAGTVHIKATCDGPNPHSAVYTLTVTAPATNYVAQIGDEKYETLAAAFAAANEATAATTITLLANTTVSETITLNPYKPVTFDLAGHTVNTTLATLAPAFKLTKGTLTVQDTGATKGGISGTGMIFRVDSRDSGITYAGGATLNINGTANVTSTDSPCVFIRGYATVNTSGNLTSSGQYATIQGNGSDIAYKTVIKVSGGSVISNDSNAIFHPQPGDLKVTGGTVQGASSGIAIKAGNLTVSGGTVKATGAANIPTEGWSNGINASGCAIQIESNTDYDDNGVSVTISNGTVESTNGAAVYEYIGKEEDTDTKLTKLKITGGTFKAASDKQAILLSSEAADANVTAVSGGSFTSAVPSGYCADGYEPSGADSNDMYTVQVAAASGVASITRGNVKTYYLTVTAALSAAQEGETVVLEQDYIKNSPSSAVASFNKSYPVTLDINGKTLENTSNKLHALKVSGGGMLTIIDTVGGGTIKGGYRGIDVSTSQGQLTIDGDLTVEGTRAAIELTAGNTQLIVKKGTIKGFDSSNNLDQVGIIVAGSGTNKTVTIEGGSVSGEYGIYSYQAATVNVSAGTVTGTKAAIALNGYQPYGESGNVNTIKLNVTGGEVKGTGEGAAISASGNENDGNYEMNLSGGTISADDVAIYHCNDGVLNVSGNVSITGATAIYQKSGTMNITGGTITGNGANAAYTFNGNGANATGDAIVIDNCGYPGGAPSASIKGATITSANGKQIGYYVNASSEEGNVYADQAYTLNTNALKDWVANTSDNKDTYPKTIGTVSYVAQIGDVQYTTLQAAFDNVQSGQTITLLGDLNIAGNNAEARLAGKTVTLDLGGHTLTGRTNLRSGNLTVQNGTISCPNGQALNVYGSEEDVANYVTLTIDKTATIDAAYAICLFTPDYPGQKYLCYGATINIYGTLNGSGGTVFVQGYVGNSETTGAALAASDNISVINVGSTAVITSTDDQAIAMNGMAKVNVEDGAQLTGREAIGLKRGILNITGGTFKATGENVADPQANNNGTEKTGAALSITSTYNYAGCIKVDISGGSFESEKGLAFLVSKSVKDENAIAFASGNPILNITGGKYHDDSVKTYVAPGYEAAALIGSEIGWFQVGEIKSTNIAKTTTGNSDTQATYTASRRVVDEKEAIIGNSNQPTVTVNLSASTGTVATNNKLPQYDQEKIVAKALEVSDAAAMNVSIDVTHNEPPVVDNKITYEVHPEATVKSNDVTVGTFIVTNDMLSGQTFTIKLPVPLALRNDETGKVKVTHKLNNGDKVVYNELPYDAEYYVTIADVTEFSEFELEKVVVESNASAAYGFTLALKNKIEIPLYVYNLSDGAENYHVYYSYTNASGNTESGTVTLGADNAVSGASGWYRVVVASFSARQLRDEVTVILYTGEDRNNTDNQIYNGTYSIYKYCDNMVNHGGTNTASLITLCKAMMDYGTAAQWNFNYNTENLSSNYYYLNNSQEMGAEYSNSFDTLHSAFFSYIGATLSLKSQTELNFYFTLKSGSIEDYTFKVNGVEVTPASVGGSYYRVTASEITAKNLDKQVTVTVTRNNTNVEESYSYSPLNYAYYIQEHSPTDTLKTVCRGLYLYWQAANDYLK